MKNEYRKLIDEILSKTFLTRIATMIFCIFLLAVNYNLFFLPNDLVIGGTSGLVIIVYNYIKVDPALLVLIFNLIFILLSFILLGKKRTSYSIIGSLLYPLFISLTSGFCAFISTKLVINDFILIVIISGALFGLANGLLYKTGFTTGGIDIFIQILNKYLKIPSGTASLLANVAIITLGGFIFGINMALYAIIVIYINSILINKIVLGISDSKMFYISTKKTEEIKQLITEHGSGYTIMKTYNKEKDEEDSIIMCVIPTKDYYLFRILVEEIDPKVFIIISDCYEVYGGVRKQSYPFIK